MTSVAVLIPVLDRPSRVAALVESIRSSDPRARPVFLCSPGDSAEIAAVHAAGEPAVIVPWTPDVGGDWAKKNNLGFRLVSDEWILFGADDLVFHPGWFDACLAAHDRTGACVVGTNDLGNQRVMSGRHSTHPLVHRDYLECGTIDEDGIVLHEGYGHMYVDDEFCQTAQARRTYVHAYDARVEHLHPDWAKGDDDETYRKGRSTVESDRQHYESRKQLWKGIVRS